MTTLFKNEYIIREAKGGHVSPVPLPLDPPLLFGYIHVNMASHHERIM